LKLGDSGVRGVLIFDQETSSAKMH
jgi:hypothetical protein